MLALRDINTSTWEVWACGREERMIAWTWNGGDHLWRGRGPDSIPAIAKYVVGTYIPTSGKGIVC